MDKFSVCIAGGGVIGLALACQLSRSPRFDSAPIVILEQETSFAQHTSSRNSEVIHAGIYYPPNSLKASLCVRGKALLYDYCTTYKIPFNKIGKCIISNDINEDSLAALEARAQANGVTDLVMWNDKQLRQAEPAVVATCALYSPSTGILDSHAYMESLLSQAQSRGVIFASSTRINRVHRLNGNFEVDTTITTGAPGRNADSYSLQCELFINCAGLGAQNLAARIDGYEAVEIPDLYPCKGNYFTYSGKNPFKHLIYPLPEANTQGLGIHSTTDLSGQLRFGPDTEYLQWADFTDPVAADQYRVDGSKAKAFLAAISRYYPQVDIAKLAPGYSGIRPKLAGPGMPVADFVIQTPATGGESGLVQLFGIESPGLTASLAIAEYVEARI